MPLPRLDFAAHDHPGQIVFMLELDPERTRGARPTSGPIVYLNLTQPRDRSGSSGTHEPLWIGGWISWTGENDGLLIPAQPPLLNRSEFAVPLSDDQLTRIEERRSGGGATFTLQLWGVARASSGLVESVTSGTFAVPFSVPRERWLEVLTQCGFGKRRIIELPPAPVAIADVWSAVSGRLEAASRELAAGRWGASLTETRVALERLADAVGFDLQISRGKEPFGNYVDTLGKALESLARDQKSAPYDLIAKLIRAAFAFASDPPHQGLDRGARDDAEFALSATITLYVYLARRSADFRSAAALRSAEAATETEGAEVTD